MSQICRVDRSDKCDWLEATFHSNDIPRAPPPCALVAALGSRVVDRTVTLFSDVANNQSISRRKTTCLTLFGTSSRPYWAEMLLLLLFYFLAASAGGWSWNVQKMKKRSFWSFHSLFFFSSPLFVHGLRFVDDKLKVLRCRIVAAPIYFQFHFTSSPLHSIVLFQ